MTKIHINKKPHRVEEKNILWFNGEKWLVREFCKSNKAAKDLLKDIEERKKNA